MTSEFNFDSPTTNEDLSQKTSSSNQCDSDAADTRIVGACFAAIIAITCVAINVF